MEHAISVYRLGRIDYTAAIERQQGERELVRTGKSAGAIFVLEHCPAVVTLGRRGLKTNLLVDEQRLHELGMDLVSSSRGGDVTVHEKGQVVVYIVTPIKPKKVHGFVLMIMKKLRSFCNYYCKIESRYDPARPGLWLNGYKFSSVGFDLTGNISMHGVSINVSNSLEGFSYINPCGLDRNAISSLSLLTGRDIDVADFMDKLAEDLRNDPVFLDRLMIRNG